MNWNRRWGAVLFLGLLAAACGRSEQAPVGPAPAATHPRQAECDRMVDEQIVERGVETESVLRAMREVPRHEFVPKALRDRAYTDDPLPIGEGQTISQPYIVAIMAELADLDSNASVLEIGTGSGYGAAVLSRIAARVYSIEILEPLARRAAGTLARLGYDNVEVRNGDGYRGWPDQGPFDAIVVTAAPPCVPEPLMEQLKVGGNLVLPVGTKYQSLRVIHRTRDGFVESKIFRVRFVKMTGEAERETGAGAPPR